MHIDIPEYLQDNRFADEADHVRFVTRPETHSGNTTTGNEL